MISRRMFVIINTIVVIVFLFGCAGAAIPRPNTLAPVTSDSISEIISRYRQDIPQMMQQDGIPGLAIAIVDDEGILWMEGFGYTDWTQRIPVTPDTLFSIQSMSKSFTATAAMIAAQEGLVNLDAPITDYLPDFHVNSIFEDQPEQKMTLRILLSHTAGFPHEAPYGGNYDLPAYSFEKHIASISDTWLKFPVGRYYGYSNLGIDLAGYILQVRSEIPFIDYVQEKVLQPLGMINSTLDVQQVRASSTRAIGSFGNLIPPPVDFLLIPSGGVWTTSADMARYIQFHINKGAINGVRLLQADLAETMYSPPNTPAQLVGSGLGIDFSSRNGARHFQHGGGGFGFNSSMVWYPDLKLGSVVLTNAMPIESLAYNLSEEVLDRIIASSPEVYAQRAEEAIPIEPAYPFISGESPLTNTQLRNLIASKAIAQEESSTIRRSDYQGKYIIVTLGIPGDIVEITDESSGLSLTYLGETSLMTEVEPGLFFSPNGTTLDTRAPNMMFNNIHLLKANQSTMVFRVIMYSICAIIFLFALLVWPIRFIFLRFQGRKSLDHPITQTQSGALVTTIRGLLILASLFSLFCVVILLLFPNMVYLSWPSPYTELSLWQKVLLRLPYISLVIAVFAASLTGLGFKQHYLSGFTRIYLPIAILVVLTFNIVILV